jgi:hypothetical protein
MTRGRGATISLENGFSLRRASIVPDRRRAGEGVLPAIRHSRTGEGGIRRRAPAGAKLLVVAVESCAETVVMSQRLAIGVFKIQVSGQDFSAEVAPDIDDAETHGAAQRAFADVGHGIGLGLPASFFEYFLNGGNIRHGQKKAVEKLLPLAFTGGKGLG